MSRGRHSAAPAAPARSVRLPSSRSLRLPALALITLLGAGALTASPPPVAADDDTRAATPTGATEERGTAAASRSDARAPLAAAEETATPAPTPEPTVEHTIPPEPTVVVSPAPTSEPAKEKAPEPLPDVTGRMWTTDAVNVRTGPSVDAEQVTTAPFATDVVVTGTTKNGYRQVVWDDAVAWISSDYLAESEPEQPEQPEQPAGATGTSGEPCSVNPEIESGLQSNAIAAYRAVCAAFPQVASYGGLRPGDSGDHGSGRAVDIMITGDTGWEIARYLQANAGALGVSYVIYQQQMWMAGEPTSSWRAMEDRGGTTANHFDHVHVSTT